MPRLPVLCFAFACAACHSDPPAPDAGHPDLAMAADLAQRPADLARSDGPPAVAWCNLPGAVRWNKGARTVVPGGDKSWPDVAFMKLPDGFCAHYFGTVGNARNMRFAPGGDLFVASPTQPTTGGGANGQSAIVVVPDDNQDGVADGTRVFIANLPSTQGLLFTADHLYYQDATRIVRRPFHMGDRMPSGMPEQVANITIYSSALHWPKTLDAADDGTIYVGNGGDQGETCDPQRLVHGAILKLDGSPGGLPIIKGLRNPFALRCARGHNHCFALELAMDYSEGAGGREKLIPIHAGDDWGYPCCATKDLPYMGVMPVPDCSGVQPENASFIIGDTPFSVDFEPGNWPAPFTGSAIVALHGAFATWVGARVVAIGMDAATGMPLPATDLNGKPSGAMRDFATGWDDGTRAYGRPAALAFSPDGRLFLANDTNGQIVWIAPIQ